MNHSARLGHAASACLWLAVAAVSGCVGGSDITTGPTPPPMIDAPPPGPEVVPQDAATLVAISYYAKVQDYYLSTDRLRTDKGGPDAPYTAADLARNFMAVAFYQEFADSNGQLVAQAREVRLQRWTRPVRIAVEFGASVPLDQRHRDLAEIAGLSARLSQLTGLPVRLVRETPNFQIIIANPGERQALAPRILGFMKTTPASAVQSVTGMQADVYCTVFSTTPGKSSFYDRALVIIRGELPDLMRRACLHEEIAQGFGLINDSPRARPSVFNDNEEFALLTRQDELMLKILYDPRLKPGMTLVEARPIVETIAAGLLPGSS